MPQNNTGKSALRERIFGRGFYIALAVCIVAAIVAIVAIPGTQNDSQPIDAPLVTNPQTTTPSTTTTTLPSTTEKPTTPSEIVIDTQVPYSSFYLNPVGGRVTKFYSDNLVYSETMGDYRTHQGVDFEAQSGQTIYAINKGTVVAVYSDELLGNVVEIDHAHNVVARYCGVETTLEIGDTINIGQAIGKLSQIPLEAGEESHLHLEIIHNGKAVDPIDLMSKNGTEGDVADEDAFVQHQPNGK